MTDTRTMLAEHTSLFLSTLERLADEDFTGPSALPGWTRAHVVAHVHYNAEALRRLTRWASTGVEEAMYASTAQRGDEIKRGAALPAQDLRSMVLGSAQLLAQELDALTEEAWQCTVVTAQGRRVPASEIPWLRTREVAVHAVDLDAGTSFADLSREFHEALSIDILARRASRGEGASIAAWLSGRAEAPELQPWL